MKTPPHQTSPHPTPDRILRLVEVTAKVGFQKTKLWELIAHGKFPEPIALGPRDVGWRESEIDAWIADLPRAPRINAGLQKARAARRYHQDDGAQADA
jgi:prophage regulatory protein